jgi:hypothetical protein
MKHKKLTPEQRRANSICGMDAKFTAYRWSLDYISGSMHEDEYAELYNYTNDETRQFMDEMVSAFLASKKGE